MPTNLYGPGDSYDPQTSHVLPALIRKFHDAKVRGDKIVSVWGTGSPRREFLYSDDMAHACIHLAELPDARLAPIFNDRNPPLVNIGFGKDLSIRELANLIGKTVGLAAELSWDTSKPDGTPRKLLDSARLASLGWTATVALENGLRLAYGDFIARIANRS